MSNYTCISCNVRFLDAETQKNHYKSDWHRYNLKRKISKLIPITNEEFQQRVRELKASQIDTEVELNLSFYCNLCRKQFQNQKVFDNHANSKKHKEKVKSIKNENYENVLIKSARKIKNNPTHSTQENHGEEEWSEIGIGDASEDENNLTTHECLFCDNESENIVKNMEHMSVAHSFFVPDIDYCIDLPNLIIYLAEKIKKYFICLFCNDEGKTLYSLDAVRKHMRDKGHCMINHEAINMVEYEDFYDYSSSYPDHVEHNDIDEEIEQELLCGTEYELVLPNGNVIGHRSLNKYFKQHLNPYRQLVPKKSKAKIMNQYKSIGWKPSTIQQIEEKKLRIKQMKYQMKLGVKANKLQHHYREQVVF